MPIFSPLDDVVVVVVEVVVFVVPVLPVVVLVVLLVLVVLEVVLEEESEPPHAANRRPKAMHSIRGMKVLFNN
jgi:hypothetical protein